MKHQKTTYFCHYVPLTKIPDAMKKINVDDFRIYRNQAQREFENSRCLFTEFASSDADADRQTDRRRWKPDRRRCSNSSLDLVKYL